LPIVLKGNDTIRFLIHTVV